MCCWFFSLRECQISKNWKLGKKKSRMCQFQQSFNRKMILRHRLEVLENQKENDLLLLCLFKVPRSIHMPCRRQWLKSIALVDVVAPVFTKRMLWHSVMSWSLRPSPGMQQSGSRFGSHCRQIWTWVSPVPSIFLATGLCCPKEEGVEIASVDLCTWIYKVLRLSLVERGKINEMFYSLYR